MKQIDSIIETLQKHANVERWDRVLYYAEKIIMVAQQNYRPWTPRPWTPVVCDSEDEEYLPTSQRQAEDKVFP